jgi:hypothetical protein
MKELGPDQCCTKCKQTKPATLEYFPAERRQRSGLASWCRLCYSAATRAHYKRDPDARRAFANDYYRTNKPDRLAYAKTHMDEGRRDWRTYLLRQVKVTANKKGRPMVLTMEDIERMWAKQKGRCYWWGIELVASSGLRDPQRPSIDRLDCSKGYYPDNVVIACLAANLARSDTTVERFREFSKLMFKCLTSAPHLKVPASV